MNSSELKQIRETLQARAVDANAMRRAIEHLASIKEAHCQRISRDRHLQTAVIGLERGLRDMLSVIDRPASDGDRAAFVHLAAIEYLLDEDCRLPADGRGNCGG
ncbi:hypothetical protein [Aliihoeflea sp. 40Bstr573]|uniref:hypothetical protein n=1 Tax=Aliihoeflea sp. 40Bstr573 TaxID=2696467 RepID=UPI002094AD0A|nr:hypothetical protein [Aliihoeflea sp. 40Bstr573]MCO6388230.1 hypothetical protein [Aliihoeflea sp. 40Bstr573]